MNAPDQDAPAPDEPPGGEVETAAAFDAAGAPTVLPPVVIVIVTHDPGPWFEDTLRSVAEQEYRNSSVLVVDNASAEDPAARIAEVLPDALLRRVEIDRGFGAACNTVLTAVQGAAFFLFCHDDVRLAPNAIQVMVEEAFRSNAGIVGPKIVDWHEPSRLLQVGMGADKTGYPAPYVDRGELDQEQHDGVRDAFYIPGAATLVRADLFSALEGFDPGIDFHGDDLDLCWRARTAGARIVVAPDATVGHLEALGVRRTIDDRRKRQMRHRLRALEVSSKRWSRIRVVPQAALLALAEIVYSVVLGRFRQARDVYGAWLWNARRGKELRARRRLVEAHRTVGDHDVRAMQARGSARFSAFLRGQIGSSEDRINSVAGVSRDLADSLRSSKARTALVAWLLVAGLLLIGSRGLLLDGVSAVGDLPMFGERASSLVDQFTSGYREVGLGSTDPNPTGLGVVGLLGYLVLGALGFLRSVLLLGMIPLGAAGIWRLCKPIGSRRARVVALVVYVATPVAYNSIAEGQWAGLMLYGLAPWIVAQYAKALGLAPFGPVGGLAGPGVRARPLVQRLVMVGVLTALAAMLFPAAVVVSVGMGAALFLGGLLVGQVRGWWRLWLVALGGACVAVVLHLPWSASWLSGGWETAVGRTSAGGQSVQLDEVLRFETGPLGSGPLGYMLLAGAALPLLIGRDWRLGWAVRAWALALGGMAAVWISAQGWLPGHLPAAEMLLAPAAVGLALAASMGMAAFEVDLPDYHFGWRQILSLVAGAALVLGLLPVLGASVEGRWGQPDGDYDQALGFLEKKAVEAPFRVLWLGDESVMPLAGWELEAVAVDDLGAGTTLAYATSRNGTPTLADRWSGDPAGATDELGQALRVAADGGTTRLGGLLAPMAVRYVVVPKAIAPEPYVDPIYEAEGITAMLEAQLDLSGVTAAGVDVYENEAWGPTRARLPAGTEVPRGGDTLASRFFPPVQGAPAVLPEVGGPQQFSGTIEEPSVVYLADAASDHWRLSVDGSEASRDDALGWANAFRVDQAGSATLQFETPSRRYLFLVGQVLLWLVALVYLLRVRVVSDERRTLPDGHDAEARP